MGGYGQRASGRDQGEEAEARVTRIIGLDHLTMLDLAPPEFVAVAARAGFDAVGLRVAPVSPDEEAWPLAPGSPMLAETMRRCGGTGLFVLGVEAIPLGPGSDLVGCERVLETAAVLGARYLNVICDDPDTGRFADLLAELAAVDPALLGYLQLCDAPTQPPHGIVVPAQLPRGQNAAASDDAVLEARAMRLLPGEGELPLAELLGALPGSLPVSAEAPSLAARRELSPAQFAARVRHALDSVLA